MLTNGERYEILHRFAVSDGMEPRGALTWVADEGLLYGVTAGGGKSNKGTVYSFSIKGGTFTLLHSFSDPEQPRGSMVHFADHLFGVTRGGGKYQEGTIFDFLVSSNRFSIIHSWGGVKSDGAYPEDGLVADKELNLYGVTSAGGRYGQGVLFRVSKNGEVAILHDFNEKTGTRPVAALTLKDSKLYGVTSAGGPAEAGSVFAFDLEKNAFKLLHSFDGKQGFSPQGSLIAVGDRLYGTTVKGGKHDLGTIFSIGLDGRDFRLLYEFDGKSGAEPMAGLTWDGKRFYGTTFVGGEHNSGTVFALELIPEPQSVLLIAGAGIGFMMMRRIRRLRGLTFNSPMIAKSVRCEATRTVGSEGSSYRGFYDVGTRRIPGAS